VEQDDRLAEIRPIMRLAYDYTTRLLNLWNHSTLGARIIHGDLIPNLSIRANKVIFFDFEDAGIGCPGYDVATFRWALCMQYPQWRLSLEGDEQLLLDRFLEGYARGKAVSTADLNLIHGMTLIRALWDIAIHLRHETDTGTQIIDADYAMSRKGFLVSLIDDIGL